MLKNNSFFVAKSIIESIYLRKNLNFVYIYILYLLCFYQF